VIFGSTTPGKAQFGERVASKLRVRASIQRKITRNASLACGSAGKNFKVAYTIKSQGLHVEAQQPSPRGGPKAILSKEEGLVP
jgi:helix-turn-helix protein